MNRNEQTSVSLTLTSESGRESTLKKLFFKKVERPLDIFSSVIYVTRITTGATTVFVSAPACNHLFGQGYAHFLTGEKAMKNKNASASASANTDLIPDENGNTNCVNCKDCTDCVNCKNCTNCANCKNCTNCSKCNACDNCNHCKACDYCANCNDCANCTDCRDCDYCNNCQECVGCANCTDCQDRVADRTPDTEYDCE